MNFKNILFDFFSKSQSKLKGCLPKTIKKVLRFPKFPDFKADELSMFDYLSSKTNPKVFA